MKMNYSSKKLGGHLLAFFLLFGVITVASSTAQAQWGRDRDDRYRRDERYRDRSDRFRRNRDWDDRYRSQAALQTARQQGYSFGMNVGAADAQRGQSFNPQRSRYYQNPNLGYGSSIGNSGVFRQVFRDAFVQGYRDGYQRYAYRNGRGRRW